MAPMFGWLSEARTSASRWKRLTRDGSRENSSGRNLIATSRLSLVSRARYTSPIPPLPRRAVISSEPSRVPTSTDIGLSIERQKYLRRHYAEKRERTQTDGFKRLGVIAEYKRLGMMMQVVSEALKICGGEC